MSEDRGNGVILGILSTLAADKYARQHSGRRLHHRQLPEISAQDVEKMVNDFATARGGIAMFQAAYAAQSVQYRV